ncbi:MAG: sulfite oxidase [Anaerolineae bacterium]|nr:sulfite oxidase [Chloroflexota bacterium]MBP6297810.1 sulfite oxidase [Anaerolineae bacterium]
MSGRDGKSDKFIVHQQSPFNGGVDPGELGHDLLTPVADFYVRGHGPIPALDESRYLLHIEGMVDRPLTLTLSDLKRDFAEKTLEITLQCAGNRRSELHAIRPMQKNALLWTTEAISNATWTGVELGDVLEQAGVRPDAAHIAMTGHDLGAAPDGGGFGGSIPVEKALQPGTLLAWAMNGEPLTAIHGAPLRAIVPGYIAARSVKWLTQVTAQEHPSTNHFQAHDYKTFPRDVTEHNVNWTGGTMLNEHATHAAILVPGEGAAIASGRASVRGYAMAAGNAVIARVELSVDGGETWKDAVFESAPRQWIWALWSTEIELAPGAQTLIVRAHDSDGYVQPRHPSEIWNFRGYQNNAWHWVSVTSR